MITAHNLEQAQNWVGVTLSENIILDESDYIEMGIACYPTPMKGNAPIKSCITVCWNVPEFNELSIKLTDGGLSIEKEPLLWDWAEKLKNTALFGVYIKMITEDHISRFKFYGMLPEQTILTILQSKSSKAI